MDSYVAVDTLSKKVQQWLVECGYYNKRHVLGGFALPVLLVVDMQEYFLNRASPAFMPAAEVILGNVKALIDCFREIGCPVIFTRHSYSSREASGVFGGWWRYTPTEGDPMTALVPALTPAEGEWVVRKEHYDAFCGTSLAGQIASLGCREVVICGVMTHVCVEATAKGAFCSGFNTIVVADASASVSEDLHIFALKAMAHCCAYIAETDEVCRLLVGNGRA